MKAELLAAQAALSAQTNIRHDDQQAEEARARSLQQALAGEMAAMRSAMQQQQQPPPPPPPPPVVAGDTVAVGDMAEGARRALEALVGELRDEVSRLKRQALAVRVDGRMAAAAEAAALRAQRDATRAGGAPEVARLKRELETQRAVHAAREEEWRAQAAAAADRAIVMETEVSKFHAAVARLEAAALQDAAAARTAMTAHVESTKHWYKNHVVGASKGGCMRCGCGGDGAHEPAAVASARDRKQVELLSTQVAELEAAAEARNQLVVHLRQWVLKLGCSAINHIHLGQSDEELEGPWKKAPPPTSIHPHSTALQAPSAALVPEAAAEAAAEAPGESGEKEGEEEQETRSMAHSAELTALLAEAEAVKAALGQCLVEEAPAQAVESSRTQ